VIPGLERTSLDREFFWFGIRRPWTNTETFFFSEYRFVFPFLDLIGIDRPRQFDRRWSARLSVCPPRFYGGFPFMVCPLRSRLIRTSLFLFDYPIWKTSAHSLPRSYGNVVFPGSIP